MYHHARPSQLSQSTTAIASAASAQFNAFLLLLSPSVDPELFQTLDFCIRTLMYTWIPITRGLCSQLFLVYFQDSYGYVSEPRSIFGTK